MDLFQPPLAPDVGLSRDSSYKVKEASYGDGYSTRLGVINAKRSAFQLNWSLLTQDQADQIEDFLDGKRGAEAFLWAPPGDSKPPVPYVCRRVGRTWNTTFQAVSATFERVFDVASLSAGGEGGPGVIVFDRRTSAQFLSANPILTNGAFGIETDTNQFKIGDGVRDWLTLPYVRAPLPGNQPFAHIEQRTLAAWNLLDPILSDQAVGYVIDTRRMKIGDGSTRWVNLPYVSTDGSSWLSDYNAFSGGSSASREAAYRLEGGPVAARPKPDYVVDAGNSATRVLL